MRATAQFDEIESGDIFHHATARFDRLPLPIDDTHANQGIAGSACLNAARARNIAGRNRADGRLTLRTIKRAIIGGLERQHLAFGSKRCLNLRQRCAGAR
jgi:hypothetical protein